MIIGYNNNPLVVFAAYLYIRFCVCSCSHNPIFYITLINDEDDIVHLNKEKSRI
jgi:hypothetical protein